MKTINLLEIRKNTKGILRHVADGECFVLSYRGHPAAQLGPLVSNASGDLAADPFFTIAQRATPSPKSKTRPRDIDSILYGGH